MKYHCKYCGVIWDESELDDPTFPMCTECLEPFEDDDKINDDEVDDFEEELEEEDTFDDEEDINDEDDDEREYIDREYADYDGEVEEDE